MGVVVKAVDSRALRKQFLALPWTLYRNDPLWIPPLRQNQKELVGYARNPFQELAETQTFLAYRDGQPCGRIAAILNRAHNRRHDEQRGFFGFFESIDDQKVATGLLDAVRDWFAERGIVELRGPTCPSMNYECGLLIEGFNHSPTFMMTYNPPYYARLVETYGYRKVQDLLTFWGPTSMISTLDDKLRFVAQESIDRFGIRIRPLDKKRFTAEIEMFLHVFNESMAGTWGFVPLARAEIQHMSAQLRHLIIPDLAIIAEVNSQPVGAVFGLPDYNPRIKEIDGRLFPFGFFKLINKRRPFKRLRVVSTNVLPEYQRWGVGLVLLWGLVPKILASGLQEVEFSWVLETNSLSRGSLQKGGAMLEKVHRLYDYSSNGDRASATSDSE